MKILVLRVPALHLGFLGCYGNWWISTPTIDRLAAEGVVFDQHFADHIGRQTAWSGQYQWQGEQGSPTLQECFPQQTANVTYVGAESVAAGSGASALEQTLERASQRLELLADRESWLCWVDLPSLYPPWNMPESFAAPYLADDQVEADDWEDGLTAEPDPDETGTVDECPEDAEETTADAEDATADAELYEPNECTSDTAEATADEELDEPFEPLPDPDIGALDMDDLVLWERLRCSYAGAVSYLDAGLQVLFDAFNERSQLDQWTIVLTSDRGLALGEHGIIGDSQPWLHDEVVHLPLIVRQPGGVGGGRRITALTQPIDLAATLHEAFGSSCAGLDGKSLLPLLRGQLLQLRQEAVTRWELSAGEEWTLRTLERVLVLPTRQAPGQLPRSPQLFLKPEDRWETNNVIQHHLDVADEMEQRLRKFVRC